MEFHLPPSDRDDSFLFGKKAQLNKNKNKLYLLVVVKNQHLVCVTSAEEALRRRWYSILSKRVGAGQGSC